MVVILNIALTAENIVQILIFSSCSIAGFACIIPLFLYSNHDILPHHHLSGAYETNVERTLHSQIYFTSLLSSAAGSIPVLVDLCLDWYFSMRPSNVICLSMWTLVLGVFVPNLIVLTSYYETSKINYVIGFSFLAHIPVIAGTAALICEYGGKIWNNCWTVASLQFYLLFIVIISFSPYQSTSSEYFIIHYLIYIFLGIASIILTFPLIKWIMYLKSVGLTTASRDDITCTVLLVGLGVLIFCGWILTFGYGSVNMIDRPPEFFTASNYLLHGFAFFVIILTGRKYRYDMSRLHERQASELDQKRSFVRYISHEIRTPLNTIQMGLQLFRRKLLERTVISSELDTDSLHEILSDLETSCNLAVEVLNSMLDYEKLESGLLKIDLKYSPLHQFIDDFVTPFKLHAREKNIQLNVSFYSSTILEYREFINRNETLMHQDHDHHPSALITKLSAEDIDHFFLKADPWKLGQVFRNLLSNAIKFTNPEGKVDVSVYILQSDKENSEVGASGRVYHRFSYSGSSVTVVPEDLPSLVVTVSDTGPGVTKLMPRSLRVAFLIIFHENSGARSVSYVHTLYRMQENQSRLFKEIIQFEPGKLQEGKGSGLGLWISGRIVNLHKGTISVHSEGEGRGSTFIVELLHALFEDVPSQSWEPMQTPLGRIISTPRQGSEYRTHDGQIRNSGSSHSNSHSTLTRRAIVALNLDKMEDLGSCNEADTDDNTCADKDDAAVIPRDVLRDVSKALFSMRVLVVDDSASNRKMLVRLLQSDCPNIDTAEDGAIALEKIRVSLSTAKDSYDVILMDYQMPNMDGPTAAKHIRELGFSGPIIGVTGNALQADVNTFLALGANKVLLKPVQFESLMRGIGELI